MIKLERQFAKRLDELEKEFLTRYKQYLDRVIYLPHLYDARQVSTMQLPMTGTLARLLTDYAHEIFAVGQAHGDILCRELHKKYAPHKLADWQPSFQLASPLEVDPDKFWLKPEAAIKALEAREIMLAGDVEADILAGVKGILLNHLHGATRPETEAALAKLIDGNMNRARLITTTETTYAYNRGRLSSFHANDVDYVQFSAVMDMRTSAQCRSRHGKIMRLNSPELAANTPPLHGRCRSVLSPIYSAYQPGLITPEATDWSNVAPLPKGWKIGPFQENNQPMFSKSDRVQRYPLKGSYRDVAITYIDNTKFVVPVDIDKTKQHFSLADIKKEFNKLPAKLKKSIGEIQILDYRNPDDLYWEQRYNIKNFRSFATGGNTQIHFYANNNHTKKECLNFLPQAMKHEAAHVFDKNYSQIRLSLSKQWATVVENDLTTTGNRWVSGYATQSQSDIEDFADSVALYLTDADNFAKKFPFRAQFLRKEIGL